MNSYKEYAVRCATCGGQIACFSYHYEQMIDNGSKPEDAFRELKLDDRCCRIEMLNPTIVFFNMENRGVIEGYISPQAVDEFDSNKGSTSIPIFGACGTKVHQLTEPAVTNYDNTKISHPIIRDIMSISNKEIVSSEPLEERSTEFTNPVLVGFPAINSNNIKQMEKNYVGANKYSQILNGRTYLAR